MSSTHMYAILKTPALFKTITVLQNKLDALWTTKAMTGR